MAPTEKEDEDEMFSSLVMTLPLLGIDHGPDLLLPISRGDSSFMVIYFTPDGRLFEIQERYMEAMSQSITFTAVIAGNWEIALSAAMKYVSSPDVAEDSKIPDRTRMH